jgi:thioredoxin reductase (NADPH)
MSQGLRSEEQVYPKLDANQMAIAAHFSSASPEIFHAGDVLFSVGERDAPAWLVLKGQLEIVRRDGLSGETVIASFEPGQFSGEVSQLSGYPALVTGRAGPDGCTALPFRASHVREMLVGAAEIGEIVMRAFILRRANLIANGGAGCVLVGGRESSKFIDIESFLRRIGYPYTVLSSAPGGDGAVIVDRMGFSENELPLMVCPNGEVLKAPDEIAIANSLGITPSLDPAKVYDVAIVGAGPAGLAAAVYAGSEGLDVIVLEQSVAGGQAGASMRIENYLGFPTGITGQQLMDRAINQAMKFGAQIALPLTVEQLVQPIEGQKAPIRLKLQGDKSVCAKTVVVASGARYRKPSIPNLASIDSANVSYWVSPIEGNVCAGEEIVLVGGGNSAGQAIVFLAPLVRRLHLVVRRPLEDTMSSYLIERIASFNNVDIHVGCEVIGLDVDKQGLLHTSTIRENKSGVQFNLPLHHLFLFIGADPNSDWLPKEVAIDNNGFIKTGPISEGDQPSSHLLPLETSIKNLFAIGDIRSGSTKRVAAAVGEGAAVVSQIHEALKRDET